MSISWNASAEQPEPEVPEPTQLLPAQTAEILLPTGTEVSNTFAPGTVYSINKNEYALTLEQDETTVTYFSIPKGQGKTVTHEQFQAMIRTEATPQ
jgi:hypothetical protein